MGPNEHTDAHTLRTQTLSLPLFTPHLHSDSSHVLDFSKLSMNLRWHHWWLLFYNLTNFITIWSVWWGQSIISNSFRWQACKTWHIYEPNMKIQIILSPQCWVMNLNKQLCDPSQPGWRIWLMVPCRWAEAPAAEAMMWAERREEIRGNIRPLPWRYHPQKQHTRFPSWLSPAPPPQSGLPISLFWSQDPYHAVYAGQPVTTHTNRHIHMQTKHTFLLYLMI